MSNIVQGPLTSTGYQVTVKPTIDDHNENVSTLYYRGDLFSDADVIAAIGQLQAVSSLTVTSVQKLVDTQTQEYLDLEADPPAFTI